MFTAINCRFTTQHSTGLYSLRSLSGNALLQSTPSTLSSLCPVHILYFAAQIQCHQPQCRVLSTVPGKVKVTVLGFGLREIAWPSFEPMPVKQERNPCPAGVTSLHLLGRPLDPRGVCGSDRAGSNLAISTPPPQVKCAGIPGVREAVIFLWTHGKSSPESPSLVYQPDRLWVAMQCPQHSKPNRAFPSASS